RGRLAIRVAVLLAEFQSELRTRPRPADPDRQQRPRSGLAQQRIDRLQHDPLPTGHRLRYLRLQPHDAVQVDLFGIDAVAAVQVDGRAGNLEHQLGELQVAVAQSETAAQ